MSLGLVDFVWPDTYNFMLMYASAKTEVPRLLDDQLANKVLSAFLRNNTISNAINTFIPDDV